ncbi:MAG: PucR family transcriptional regulator, partial [Actinomycetes bacterium]
MIEAVARRAAADAGLGTDLLGTYLFDAMDVASAGRRLSPGQVEEYQRLGGRAAEDGVDLPALLDLYLSATWRLWDTMTSIARGASGPDTSVASALFRAADDAAAALGRGYTRAQRRAIRREEALRRELVDDLLAGRNGPETHQQARRAGFNLAASHRVVVAEAVAPVHDAGPVQWAVEAALVDDLHRGGFVATKDGRLVCVLPAADADPAVVLRAVTSAAAGDWRLGVGQAREGAAGVGESYREAIAALDLAGALGLSARVVDIAALAPFGILTQNPQLLGRVVE